VPGPCGPWTPAQARGGLCGLWTPALAQGGPTAARDRDNDAGRRAALGPGGTRVDGGWCRSGLAGDGDDNAGVGGGVGSRGGGAEQKNESELK
jgi:hypothetical protein